MAKDQKPFGSVEQAAEKTMEQAQGAMENYFSWVQKDMSGSPWGTTEFGEKIKSYAEKNIAAVHEHVQKLSQAKDFQDIFRLQTEFMQTQMSSFADQLKDVGESYSKAMAGAVKTPFNMSS